MSRPRMFKVECCGARRSLFPGGVLVCALCDHTAVSAMPNENKVRAVPEGNKVWTPGLEEA